MSYRINLMIMLSLGLLSCVISWSLFPKFNVSSNIQSSMKCLDYIIPIDDHQQPWGAPCKTSQELIYMRDLNADKYILCRCKNNPNFIPRFEDPKLPDILIEPMPDSIDNAPFYVIPKEEKKSNSIEL